MPPLLDRPQPPTPQQFKRKHFLLLIMSFFLILLLNAALLQNIVLHNSVIHKPISGFEKKSSPSSWDKAILEAEVQLRNEAPSCLIPDKAKTAGLVKRALEEQRRVDPARRTNKHPHGAVSLLPLPVLNMGMPKCGSSTLFEFFDCIGFASTHWDLNTNDFEGMCMRDAVNAGLPPLATCAKQVDALMQFDVELPFGHKFPKFKSNSHRNECFFPQLSLLDELHEEAPNATFVLNFRPINDWIHSIVGWSDMMHRFRDCDLPNLPRGQPTNLTDKDGVRETMALFFCSHVLHLRTFVESHPSHALIELDLYDTEVSSLVMSALFPSPPGKLSSSECWKHKNKSKPPKKKV